MIRVKIYQWVSKFFCPDLSIIMIIAGFIITTQIISAPLAFSQKIGASGLALPRFVSLKSNRVNMRIGPGRDYKVQWMYVRRYLPMEVIREFGNWRNVRDPKGVEGWILHSLLSSTRIAIITPWDMKSPETFAQKTHEQESPNALFDDKQDFESIHKNNIEDNDITKLIAESSQDNNFDEISNDAMNTGKKDNDKDDKTNADVLSGTPLPTINMHASAKNLSAIIARIEAGSLALVESCENNWCELSVTGGQDKKISGHVSQSLLWGVYPDEKF